MAKGHSPNQGQHYSDGMIWLGQLIQRVFKTSAVTVTITAGKIPASKLSKRKTLTIINTSATTVYIGNSSVTDSTGFPIYQRASVTLSVNDDIDVYAIVASSTAELRIIEGS